MTLLIYWIICMLLVYRMMQRVDIKWDWLSVAGIIFAGLVIPVIVIRDFYKGYL